MAFGERLSKLFTNKYFLYFVVFLASTNILGYILTNKIQPIIYFVLISLLTSYFSRNMAVILLVGLLLTNLLVSKKIIEGLTNNDNNDNNDVMQEDEDELKLIDIEALTNNAIMDDMDEDEERLIDIDKELKSGVNALRKTDGDVTKAKEIISE